MGRGSIRAASNGTKAVGIWIRVSTEDQVRGESPDVHEKRARMYAEARGWRTLEIYRLEAVSGKTVMQHPEAQRMLADIRSGRISGLIFSKIARLARNTRELLDFADAFRDANADMISLQEAIDTGSPAGRLFFTIVAAMAQWEREEIASRVAAAVPIRARLGRPVGGAAPFGYRWHNKKLEPDPTEAPVRKLLYELFAEHRRKKAVARMLNERGYRTRNGSRFSDTTVERLVRDPTAKGIYRQNYTKTRNNKKSWELKPESEWVHTPVEPIITMELWDACNGFLDGRARRERPPARQNVHLFSGYATCICGEKMRVWSQSPKYICPKCRNKIPMRDLEAIFRDRLSQYILSPEEIAAHFSQADNACRVKVNLIEAAQKELEKIKSEGERLYQLYLADKVSTDGFGERNTPLETRKKQLEEELPRLQAQLDVMRISNVADCAAASEAADLATRWRQLSEPEKRQLVEAITESIVVGKEDVTIDLLYIPAIVQQHPMVQRQCDSKGSSRRRAESAPGSAHAHWRAPRRPPPSRSAAAGIRARRAGIPAVRRETGRQDGRAKPRPA